MALASAFPVPGSATSRPSNAIGQMEVRGGGSAGVVPAPTDTGVIEQAKAALGAGELQWLVRWNRGTAPGSTRDDAATATDMIRVPIVGVFGTRLIRVSKLPAG